MAFRRCSSLTAKLIFIETLPFVICKYFSFILVPAITILIQIKNLLEFLISNNLDH